MVGKIFAIAFLMLPLNLHGIKLLQSHQKPSKEETACLSTAIYMESRGEPYKGRKAVADVIINRSLRSGESICKVIRKPFQFSFMNGRKNLPRVEKDFWKEAERHLVLLENGFHKDSTHGAMFFFRADHHSALTRKLKLVKIVGRHKLMKEG